MSLVRGSFDKSLKDSRDWKNRFKISKQGQEKTSPRAGQLTRCSPGQNEGILDGHLTVAAQGTQLRQHSDSAPSAKGSRASVHSARIPSVRLTDPPTLPTP